MKTIHDDIKKGIFLDQNDYTKKRNISTYNNKKIQDYENNLGIFNTENQKRIEGTIRKLSKNSPGDISVDVGIGSGNVYNISRKYFNRCYGIDTSLKLAIEKEIDKNSLIKADGLSLPIRSNSIDLISAYCFLHHLDNQLDFFKESHRCLKQNGILYTDGDKNIFFMRIYVRIKLIKAKLLNKTKEISYFQNYFEDHGTGERYFGGLDHKKMFEELRIAGFRDISIIFRLSNNPKYTDTYIYKLLQMMNLSFLSSHFYIVARK